MSSRTFPMNAEKKPCAFIAAGSAWTRRVGEFLILAVLLIVSGSTAAQDAERPKESKATLKTGSKQTAAAVNRQTPNDDAAKETAAAKKTNPTLAEEVAELREQITALTQKLATQEKKSAEKNTAAGWRDKRPFIRSDDGNRQLEFIGYGQADFRAYQRGRVPVNSFVMRRARLGIRGKLYQYYEFNMVGDFADTESALLRNLYVNINYLAGLQFRFGQFKEPFSQEELHSSGYLDFVERAMVNNLAPGRSPGAQIWGELFGEAVLYQLGAFNGKGVLAANTSNTPEVVMRLRFSPWVNTNWDLVKGLSFGGAYADGKTKNEKSLKARTESRSITFFNATPVNGDFVRANAELTYLQGPFAYRTEYVQTRQHRDGLGPNQSDLSEIVAKGYMAQMTYLLTGEDKPEEGAIIPRRGFLNAGGEKSGAGAWEIKLRYSSLRVNDGALNPRAEVYTTGFNWYMSSYVKYVVDLNLERFSNPVFSPRADKKNFITVLARVQFLL